MKTADIMWLLLKPESYKWRHIADTFIDLDAKVSTIAHAGYYEMASLLLWERHEFGEIAGSLVGKHYEPRLVY
ncbi:hypothetical protein [Pantoea eucrina]|uniref:hypothetical protein n=1 Tax=Pantoea eucrina TaxID=472693 RepID=UPI00080F4CAD|nr:hypothetical protein [Pantoea eucrina]